MKITKVKVSNYRNINDITVYFNPECNYIIGDNNLGKSNFLSLLSKVFDCKGFEENDYFDPEKPIDIEIEIALLVNEQGFFEENFTPDNASIVKVRYQQSIQEAYPVITRVDSNESIQAKQLKKIHYLKYETTSIPSNELRFDSKKGAGLLFAGIIERFIENDKDQATFLNDDQVNSLLEFINGHLTKIGSLRDYAIKATVASNTIDMLSGLLYLSDGQRNIDSTSSGIQYIAMASLNILCQIMELYKSKSMPFEEQLYTDDNGKRILPLILSIDEPEVHLHPFLQRSLIGHYKRILHNEDAEFRDLLKLCFGVDGIEGQLIIVTHSTDALIGDYRNLVRFYKDGFKTAVICGANPLLRLTTANEKHLIMHFPEIKEAFYAHCVILIEGETEYGCIRAFAEKIDISLDDYGICVINARGEGTIKPLRQLLSAFSIPSIAIYDGDVKVGHTPNNNEFFTHELCFEIEIVKKLYANAQTAKVRQIALDMDERANSRIMEVDYVRKHFKKMGIDISDYVPKKLSDVREDDENEFCQMYSAWFMSKKGVLLGRIIGETLSADLIPECYVDAIKKAREVAINS